MIPILAQFANTTASELGLWVICLTCFLVILNQGAGFIDRFRSRPPAHELYATKHEVREVSARVDAICAKIEDNYNKIMEKSAESRSRMHKEIGDIATSVHRIEGKLGI
jgi:hypothetical protein